MATESECTVTSSGGSGKPWLAPALACVLALAQSCGKHSPSQPDSGAAKGLVGKWADLANAPGTLVRECCFYDSTAEEPCGPDTLILREDGSMTFTSVIDEPSSYRVAKDTLYRFRGSNPDDSLKSAFTLSRDTLSFATSPLCQHKVFSPRYRKVPD
ncbi:MAG: hypothetical protein JWO30_4773 [Fibrobacteres bacterium]|nr:hypothetical protein [Fibrobacterota bacterium]